MPLIIILAMFVSSCSTFFLENSAERYIANEVNPPLSVDELFTIKSSTQIHAGNDYVKNLLHLFKPEGISIDFILDPKMASSEAYKIIPTIEDQAYKIQIFHSAQARFDADATYEMTSVINELIRLKFANQFAIFEFYYNAKLKHFPSLQIMAKIRQEAVSREAMLSMHFPTKLDFEQRMAENFEEWKKINEKFETEERIYNKKIKLQENARREMMDNLDKAVDSEQFRSLVAKNDRKGAAELLRKYLPWEHMPPFEKLFWENHLSIMADPLPLEDRVLIYRGINDDIVQVAEVGGKALDRAEAIKEQQIFLMSTLMTKNQGTWNRRLRSLTAMYEKFMGTDKAGSSEYTRAARITNMFVRHSEQPQGSPFLSYTPKFSVASGFGNKRNTAYFIDPRSLYFNYASKYSHEVEFLLPIISFPDDLAAVWDKDIHQELNNEDFFKKKAIEKLDQKLGAGKGAQTYDRIVLNSTKYFKPVLGIGGKVGAVSVPVAKPDGKFISFFKKLFGMKTPAVAEEITAKSDMPCLDLIQLFWK